jgi:hypothetical protein
MIKYRHVMVIDDISGIYRGLADELLSAIEDKNYFTGEIEYVVSGAEWQIFLMRCDIRIHRLYDWDGAGKPHERIDSIIPVWWSVCAVDSEGAEYEVTAFNWSEFLKYLY